VRKVDAKDWSAGEAKEKTTFSRWVWALKEVPSAERHAGKVEKSRGKKRDADEDEGRPEKRWKM
jgi:hypothetical protein